MAKGKDMNEELFLEKVVESGVSFYQNLRQYYREEELPTFQSYLRKRWVVGGMSGGSCWGDDADKPISAHAEPEFVDLDNLLTLICPNISFLQYKSILNIVESKDDRENEYYGNYTEYEVKYISLGSLYNKLKDLNVI
jgi:hypothetical protein